MNQSIALFVLGMVVGKFLPAIPEPLGFLNQYVPVVLIIVAVYLFIKG